MVGGDYEGLNLVVEGVRLWRELACCRLEGSANT
jgi:hypothetical protein